MLAIACPYMPCRIGPYRRGASAGLGEMDKLAFDEAGVTNSASLQNGAAAGLQTTYGALEALQQAEKVVIAVDGDPAGEVGVLSSRQGFCCGFWTVFA